jgi:hypothetical protein
MTKSRDTKKKSKAETKEEWGTLVDLAASDPAAARKYAKENPTALNSKGFG